MGIYFSKIRSILEVKRKVDGQEQDLDEDNKNSNQETDNEPEEQDNQDNNQDEEDEHQADNSASDYSMDVEDDGDNTEGNEPAETSAEDDDNTTDEEDEHQADNSASDYSMDTNEGDDSGDDGNTETEDSGDSDGYSMDTGDDDGEGTDDTEAGDETTDETPDDSGSEGDNELQSLENDLFKDITPEQMNIKILELKKQYLEVYSTITDVLTRTNKIQKTTQNIKVLEFIINKLIELKDIVQFYLSNTFDTKTYMENMVNYQQYLVTLNTINRLLKEINVKKGK